MDFCETNKHIGINISKNVCRQYSEKLSYHAKNSSTDAFKTASKRPIQKKGRRNW